MTGKWAEHVSMQELARQLGVLYLKNQCAQLRWAAKGAGLQSSQPHTRIMAVSVTYAKHVVLLIHTMKWDSGTTCTSTAAIASWRNKASAWSL